LTAKQGSPSRRLRNRVRKAQQIAGANLPAASPPSRGEFIEGRPTRAQGSAPGRLASFTGASSSRDADHRRRLAHPPPRLLHGGEFIEGCGRTRRRPSPRASPPSRGRVHRGRGRTGAELSSRLPRLLHGGEFIEGCRRPSGSRAGSSLASFTGASSSRGTQPLLTRRGAPDASPPSRGRVHRGEQVDRPWLLAAAASPPSRGRVHRGFETACRNLEAAEPRLLHGGEFIEGKEAPCPPTTSSPRLLHGGEFIEGR